MAVLVAVTGVVDDDVVLEVDIEAVVRKQMLCNIM